MASGKPIVPVSALDALAVGRLRAWIRRSPDRRVDGRATRRSVRGALRSSGPPGPRSSATAAAPSADAASDGVRSPMAGRRRASSATGAVRYAPDHSHGARRRGRDRRAAAARADRSAGSRRRIPNAPSRRTPSCRSTSGGRTPRSRGRSVQRDPRCRLTGSAIERASSDGADLDAVAALEAASFTNPWTREMLGARARHVGGGARLRPADAGRRGRRVLLVLDPRSTNCTSTRSRSIPAAGGRGSPRC